jgi:nucleotide-binding universal stress UspA family protein
MKLERIVVGVDGSPNSVTALEWAVGLAEPAGAEVVAVHALGLLARLGAGPPVPASKHRAEIVERFERDWCARLDRATVPCRRLVRDGSPVGVVLAVADEVDADMVVVGSRGVGAHPGSLLGSTSAHVAQHAHQPVLVVPATRGADDAVDPR